MGAPADPLEEDLETVLVVCLVQFYLPVCFSSVT